MKNFISSQARGLLALSLMLGAFGCKETPVETLPPAPRVVSFAASATRLPTSGPVTLSWDTTFATEVVLTDANQGAVSGTDNRDKGSVEVTVARTTLFV